MEQKTNKGDIALQVVSGVLLMIVGLVGLRVGSPYWRSYLFRRSIQTEVDSNSVRPHPNELHEHILKVARETGLNIGADDITVAQLPLGRLRVRVHYSFPVNLGWYQYKVGFDFVSQAPPGAS